MTAQGLSTAEAVAGQEAKVQIPPPKGGHPYIHSALVSLETLVPTLSLVLLIGLGT
jgi:hypothetical protein